MESEQWEWRNKFLGARGAQKVFKGPHTCVRWALHTTNYSSINKIYRTHNNKISKKWITLLWNLKKILIYF